MESKGATYRIPVYRVSMVRDGSVSGEGKKPTVRAPKDAADLMATLVKDGFLPDDGREHFGILLLDIRHRVIGVHEVSVGSLSSSLVHPREVFAPALGGKAAAIVLYHNHPSGDPEPSADDIALTRRLFSAGTLLGIEVLDHVIVGDGSEKWVSLKDRGVL